MDTATATDDYENHVHPRTGRTDLALASNDRTNLGRALNGRDMAALALTGSAYLPFADYETGLQDALANLLHFARRYDIDFDRELTLARSHVSAEARFEWDQVPE